MASYRTYVLNWGPLCINFHRLDRGMVKARRYKRSAVLFFGIGSIGWWGGSRSWPKVYIIPATRAQTGSGETGNE